MHTWPGAHPNPQHELRRASDYVPVTTSELLGMRGRPEEQARHPLVPNATPRSAEQYEIGGRLSDARNALELLRARP